MKDNGGNFTTDELDLFLSVYNQLSDAYDKGLVSEELLYGNFSDGLMRAYQNKEIQEYLKKIRIENEDYFRGFDNLAELFGEYGAQ